MYTAQNAGRNLVSLYATERQCKGEKGDGGAGM